MIKGECQSFTESNLFTSLTEKTLDVSQKHIRNMSKENTFKCKLMAQLLYFYYITIIQLHYKHHFIFHFIQLLSF